MSHTASESTDASERFDFSGEEKKILAFWREIDAFKTSLKLAEGRPLFSFFDGPPFATGLPHYGHLLAGTIKDVVTRYASMNGYHVERRFGWDCHGLPVEYEIDKKLGILGKPDVLKMGIDKYNAECRAIVMRYSKEWEAIVERSGRWIDFENDTKTMYTSYMESVWWVFKALFEKGQVYRKFRVMPFSTACSTPLSNFELAQNYKDTNDPSVVVAFPIVDDADHASLLVWTTTPWTLPSNLMICANPDFDYVHVRSVATGKVFVALEKRLEFLFSDPSKDVKILKRLKGSELVGIRYVPLFGYFGSRVETFPRTFTVVADTYVTDDCGTGLVHQAPAFGQEDFEICGKAGVIVGDDVPCPIDEKGCFKDEVTNFAGLYWRDANPAIIKHVEESGRLFSKFQITHSYPHCWRSDTPLIYRAVSSWFVRVSEIIPQLLETTSKTHWVPEFVQEKRMYNWISSAPDWAVSRNRYWGTPIPLWVSDDYEEVVCVGSVEELERLSGVVGITDLHREFIDHITIPSRKGKGLLHRVEEVLDCWFESGCVPYGQQHYPFENKDRFERSFPADFIGEGIDQTRGWFYVLIVLGTHLFGQAPFKNLIVNGHVLAGDGKKMSKRLKNYPEPTIVLEQYGADALRLYMMNSPVVRAESLKFKEEGVKNIVRDVLLPWYNSYRFLASQIESFEVESGSKFCFEVEAERPRDNVMDSWILATFQTLVSTVRTEMDSYKLYAVVPLLLKFIESLTNWYIRFNRRRLKGEYGLEEMGKSVGVLFEVVYSFSLVMASFTPFFAETLYLRLHPYLKPALDKRVGDTRSVHFLSFPQAKPQYLNQDIERAFARLQEVVERVRTMRENKTIPLKTPLRKVIVVSSDPTLHADLESLRAYILDELNVQSVELTSDEDRFSVKYRAMPNFKTLGQRLKKDLVAVQGALKEATQQQLQQYVATNEMQINGHVLCGDDIQVVRVVEETENRYEFYSAKEFVVLLDVTVDAELKEEGLGRELINRLQRLRKKAGLKPTDEVRAVVQVVADPEGELEGVLERQLENITKAIKSQLVISKTAAVPAVTVVAEEENQIGQGSVRLLLHK